MKRTVMGLLIVLVVVSASGFVVLSRDDHAAAPAPQALGPPTTAQRPQQPQTSPSSPATATPADRPAGRRPAWRVREMPPDYQVLLDRSMFARQPSGAAVAGRNRPATPVEAALVLRGVTVQAGDVTALVEDLGSGRMHRLHAGDAIGPGRVARVGLDGVVYESAGRPTQISIGHDLSGATAAAMATAGANAKGGSKAEHPPKKRRADRGQDADPPRDADATATTRAQGDREE